MRSGSRNTSLLFLKKQATLTKGNVCLLFGEGWRVDGQRKKKEGIKERTEQKTWDDRSIMRREKDARKRGRIWVSFGSNRAVENFWHSDFSPPLAPCNGCHFGFSQQAQSRPEMLTLICLTHSSGDGIKASEWDAVTQCSATAQLSSRTLLAPVTSITVYPSVTKILICESDCERLVLSLSLNINVKGRDPWGWLFCALWSSMQ